MVIYCTTNLVNGKKYIGQDSKNDPNYLGSGAYFSRALKKYGFHNFKKQILQDCIDVKDLNESEIYWINYFNAAESSLFYNLTLGGHGVRPNEEVRRKMSLSKKGKTSPRKGHKLPEKQKQEHSKKMKGKPAWNKGIPRTEEEKKSHSEKMKGRIPWNKGLKMDKNSEQYKKFIKTSFKKGHEISDELKEKIIKANLGKPRSEETKRKISESQKGKFVSLESRKKMSEARKNRFKKN